MNLTQQYSHHHAQEVLEAKFMLEEVLGLPQAAEQAVAGGSTKHIKAYYRGRLGNLGWALKPRVHDEYGLNINAIKDRVGLTVQSGNVTRAFYDLMKFQVMYLNDKIDSAVLIVPTQAAAKTLGKNVANFSRVSEEMVLFRHVITVPCFVLGFQ